MTTESNDNEDPKFSKWANSPYTKQYMLYGRHRDTCQQIFWEGGAKGESEFLEWLQNPETKRLVQLAEDYNVDKNLLETIQKWEKEND